MAEIPVERKAGGLPWWATLLGLLALLLVIFLASRACSGRAAVATDAGVANANANSNARADTRAAAPGTGAANGNARIDTQGVGTTTGERVTDVSIFGSTADKASLAGRGVDVQNVRVNRVLSDRVFTVTSGSGEMFALLDDKLNAGAMEQQVKIQPGQMLNLGGTFQRVPTSETANERGRDLDAAEYARMKDQQIYLHVTGIKGS